MSTYGSLEAARSVWGEINEAAQARGQEVRIGLFIAEVVLEPGYGFDLEDLGEADEHVTIWGEASRLAAAVSRIYPASTTDS